MMIKDAVEKKGEVRIRELPKAERIRLAAKNTVKHLEDTIVTKTELMKTYEMSHREVTELVHFMMEEGTLIDKGRGFTWENQYKVQKPPPPKLVVAVPETPSERAHRLKMEKLFQKYGYGKCTRCGGTMPGKGQHNRSKRGHTQAICDLQMVKLIQES